MKLMIIQTLIGVTLLLALFYGSIYAAVALA